MSMSRRGFLGAMMGAMAAPAIVRAESLMKIVAPKEQIILFTRYPITGVDSIRIVRGGTDATPYQDAFGETFFPTAIVDPKTAGLILGAKFKFNDAGLLVRAS